MLSLRKRFKEIKNFVFKRFQNKVNDEPQNKTIEEESISLMNDMNDMNEVNNFYVRIRCNIHGNLDCYICM